MSIPIFSRLRWLLERRARARRCYIPYNRDAKWAPPMRLCISGRWIDLSYPADEGSSIALKDIFISDVYWLDQIKDKRIHTILDIGAHAGFFSLAARNAFPKALIHAYEPNETLWPHLHKHAASGGFEAFPRAVGAETCKVMLLAGKDSVFTKCSRNEQGAVSMISIDEAINDVAGTGDLDLLKMDCEGGEWEILTCTDALKRVRYITMEYHLDQERKLSDLRQQLSQMGFEIQTDQSDGDDYGRILAARRVR